MKMLFCTVAMLATLTVTQAWAQTVKTQAGLGISWSAKSENACYKCCRRWQTRMGWSPSRVEVCTQKCIIGTGRNC